MRSPRRGTRRAAAPRTASQPSRRAAQEREAPDHRPPDLRFGQPSGADALQAFWGEVMAGEEPLREQRFPLVEVQTSIAMRVIARYLGRPRTVLDAGAGTGRFSLPIAALGHRVTHLDFSPAMLRRAPEAAGRRRQS